VPRYKELNVNENDTSSEKEYLRYFTPFYFFGFSFGGLYFICSLFENNMNQLESYLLACIIYCFIYYLGMYRRLGIMKDKQNYNKAISNNKEFFKYSFNPFSIILSILGIIVSLLSYTEVSNTMKINIDTIKHFLEITVFNFNIDSFSLLNSIAMWGKIVVFIYLISFPLQIVAYFFLVSIEYIGNYGKPYFSVVKNIINILKKIDGFLKKKHLKKKIRNNLI
jgi:hypothetical protein